jgi:hypothetical protein
MLLFLYFKNNISFYFYNFIFILFFISLLKIHNTLYNIYKILIYKVNRISCVFEKRK